MLSILASLLLMPGAFAAMGSKALFTEYTVTLPFKATQPVMSANVSAAPGDELLVLGVTEGGLRQLAVYSYDASAGKIRLVDLLTLDMSIFAADVGEPDAAGGQSVYFLSRAQIFRYQYVDPLPVSAPNGPVMDAPEDSRPAAMLNSTSRLVVLQQVRSMYLATESAAIHWLDFAKHLNNDQHDDFIVAGFEQLHVYLSTSSDGSEPLSAKPATIQYVAQSLDIPSLLSVENDTVSFQPPEVFSVDMDGDGRLDLVKVNDSRLDVYAQTGDGQFSPSAQQIALKPGIEGINWWDKVDADGKSLDQSQLYHQKVIDITDINGDALPDLVVVVTRSSGVLERHNDFEFYFARQQDTGLYYSGQADTRIQSDSTLSDLKIIDVNNDARQEILVSAFDLGLSQIIGALLSSSIEQEALIYQMDDQQQFGTKPSAAQDVEITFSLSSGRSGEPMVKVEDLNGDGIKDLLYSDAQEQIKVNWGMAQGKSLFSRRAEKFAVQVPKNAKYIADNDVNQDGKIDLILHYSRADSEELLNKMVVLIAN